MPEYTVSKENKKESYRKIKGRTLKVVYTGGEVALGDILAEYKKRWRIETSFRVHDEARIKCKSKDMKIRYFLFLFEQMLQTIWICFFKEEATFKEFIIGMSDMSLKWTKGKELSS